jgi:hypothetical protein
VNDVVARRSEQVNETRREAFVEEESQAP